jgi:fibronectin-binding autotransporter adhesin
MTTGNTTLLGLALPVEGELDGTWGDAVNDQITSLLDTAVAGTTTLSADSDVTLTDTVLTANQARQAVLLWTASNGASTRNVTAPARSKPYIVINAGTGSIVLRGAGPTTGVTIISGEKCLAAWNGSDFVKVASSLVSALTGILLPANGGTGVANGTNNTITFTGNHTLGVTLTGNTAVTLPTTGTLGYLNIPSAGAAKTTSYTLATTDIGEFVEVGSGGSITVPTSTFAAGDAVVIFNNTTGNITLTTSAPTAYIGGTNTTRTSVTLATRGICNVLFVTPTLVVITGNVT